MRYWWVNQNQTYRHEVSGGYIWSPKLKRNGSMNPYYEFMREVAPGDRVFSFFRSCIGALGIARSYAYEAPQPIEFGAAGRNWDLVGWRVDVRYLTIPTAFRPADWIEHLRPLLPSKYSPLLPDGRGSQSVYLTPLPPVLALKLADLLGTEYGALVRTEIASDFTVGERSPESQTQEWEEHIRQQVEADQALTLTTRQCRRPVSPSGRVSGSRASSRA